MATTPAFPIVRPYTPELLPCVQREIEQLIKRKQQPNNAFTVKVLEIGSGYSTIWFALIGCEVTSIEHDIGWRDEVLKVNRRLKLPIELIYSEPDMIPHHIKCFSTLYDFIYIDCIDEQRITAFNAAIPLLKNNGFIILDDTHWDMFKPILDKYKDNIYITVSGKHKRKTGDVCFHQTTILNSIDASKI